MAHEPESMKDFPALTNKDFFLHPHSRGLQQIVFTQTQRDKLKYNTDSSE
jgi:hypothetical protein